LPTWGMLGTLDELLTGRPSGWPGSPRHAGGFAIAIAITVTVTVTVTVMTLGARGRGWSR
jgi:hypothetical protein